MHFFKPPGEQCHRPLAGSHSSGVILEEYGEEKQHSKTSAGSITSPYPRKYFSGGFKTTV
uniref:Uncharacterized protein n=1 Tax=Anguilla anguilla TaxID=7936 RepID=A0A0E9P768_ANGAN